MSHTIEIVITEEGETTVETKGVKGSGCQALTKAIEAALGSTTGDVKKPEYFANQGGSHVQQR